MPLRLSLLRRLRMVDDSYKPVPVVPNTKDAVAVYGIGIFKRSADLIKIEAAAAQVGGAFHGHYCSRGVLFNQRC